MKAVVLREGGRLRVEDWPRPSAGAGELLVRLRGCGLCGSDIAKVAAAPASGLVLGHELSRLTMGKLGGPLLHRGIGEYPVRVLVPGGMESGAKVFELHFLQPALL